MTGLALVDAAHPLPCAVVTAGAVTLAIAAGNRATTCALVGAAVLAGQATVGWSNDRVDVERDRRVGHPRKPLAAGKVPLPLVDAALGVAVIATCVLSLLLGWRAGLLHLSAVAAAWIYNIWLKQTLLSWLPHAYAFGALPAVAAFALPAHPAPAAWIMVTGALLGTSVNFVDVMPRMASHPRSDVHALPDRLGGRASLLVAAALVAAAAALIVLAPPGSPQSLGIACGALTLVLLLVGVPLLWRVADTRLPFYGLLAVVAILLLTLVLTAHPLY